MRQSTEIHTPEQRRAEAAWDKTQGLQGDRAKDLHTQCKQTSARILNSGLLPALAFLDAKTNDNDADKSGPSGQMKKCLDAISDWIAPFSGSERSGAKEIINALIAADSATLRRAQTEALAYLEWLARFAEGRKAVNNGQ